MGHGGINQDRVAIPVPDQCVVHGNQHWTLGESVPPKRVIRGNHDRSKERGIIMEKGLTIFT